MSSDATCHKSRSANEPTLRTLAAMMAVMVGLAGCSTLKVMAFKKADESGERIGQVDVFLTGAPTSDAEGRKKFDEVTASFGKDPIFEQAANQGKCVRGEVAPSDAITAIWLSAVGKLLFDLYADSLSQAVQRLRAEAAPSAYGRHIIVSGQELVDANCALIVRRGANAKRGSLPGLIALLRIDKHGKAFSITPVYVRAMSAVAVTAPAKSLEQPPTIHIAFGVSTKAIGEGDAKLPTVAVVGLGGVSLAQVQVGSKGAAMCTKEDCPKSDLIAYPPSKTDVASFSLTVSEVGNVGFDLDATAAQITAIKAAIGPAISDLLKEKAK